MHSDDEKWASSLLSSMSLKLCDRATTATAHFVEPHIVSDYLLWISDWRYKHEYLAPLIEVLIGGYFV